MKAKGQKEVTKGAKLYLKKQKIEEKIQRRHHDITNIRRVNQPKNRRLRVLQPNAI